MPAGTDVWSRVVERLAGSPASQGVADLATVSIVVSALEGAALTELLASLAIACGAAGPEVIVVDGRPAEAAPLAVTGALAPRIVRSAGGGRAGARNTGMRAATSEWVVHLDEGLVVGAGWYDDLRDDLARAGRAVAAVAARARDAAGGHGRVPVDTDVAYRRLVALSVGGFQDRFPRAACHGDVELIQHLARAGWMVVSGSRTGAAPAPDRRSAGTGSPAPQPFAAERQG